MVPSDNLQQSGLDRFARGRTAQWLAAAWGFAEATFFFLVPDVFLSLLAIRAPRPATTAAVAGLVGALTGGTLMYFLGGRAPDSARGFLKHVPGIHASLIESVGQQIHDRGLRSVLIGPIRGIPYKIYAMEWGADRGGLCGFLLISI